MEATYLVRLRDLKCTVRVWSRPSRQVHPSIALQLLKPPKSFQSAHGEHRVTTKNCRTPSFSYTDHFFTGPKAINDTGKSYTMSDDEETRFVFNEEDHQVRPNNNSPVITPRLECSRNNRPPMSSTPRTRRPMTGLLKGGASLRRDHLLQRAMGRPMNPSLFH